MPDTAPELPPLEWEPIPGLEVIEPRTPMTDLDSYLEYQRAVLEYRLQ